MSQNDIGNNNVGITKQLPTVLSFCSGYGGIERGLDLAGFKHRVIAYVEIEAYAIANLANKMEAGKLLPAPIWSNLKTLPVQPFRDKVDLITGGYPCQPFSAAGQRKGEDDPRHLWPFIRKHIKAIRPVQCFFENVEGHISLGLSTVISDLEEDGYVCSWGIFSAEEVGAPHQRKRVYILADSSRNGGGRELRNLSSENESIEKPKKHWKNSPRLPDDAGENAGANILADSNGVRCDRGQLSDRVSERSVEIEAQQRPEQSVVRSKVEGCGGKTRKSHWEIEPNVGRVVDGCSDRVDRIRALGNAVVPQTAAKAWVILNSRLNTTEGR